MTPVGRLVVVAGPTGTGKSDLAVALAHRLSGEIVNADSMQLYRGMDIGTAKLPVADRQGVPHHLLDVLDVTERASVAAYQRDARAVVEDVLARGSTPVLVGGSGLYVQAVIDEIAFPATDPQVRARWLQQLAERGPHALHAELARRDPAAAEQILPTDGRRVVRALEVGELTGRPFGATLPRPGPARYDAVLLVLDRSPAELDQRLADRVDAMVAAGFADEVRELLERGLREGPTARKALGYAQLTAALDGTTPFEQAVADTVTVTRRFVRRQRSWFRRDVRRRELDAGDPELLARALAAVTARRAPAQG